MTETLNATGRTRLAALQNFVDQGFLATAEVRDDPNHPHGYYVEHRTPDGTCDFRRTLDANEVDLVVNIVRAVLGSPTALAKDLAQNLGELDTEALLSLLHATQDVLAGREERKLVDQIKEVLAEDEEFQAGLTEDDEPITVTKVVFTTWDWDNGWFYYPNATVYFSDGVDIPYDFHELDEVLTDMSSFASLGERSTLTVNLTTGEVSTE